MGRRRARSALRGASAWEHGTSSEQLVTAVPRLRFSLRLLNALAVVLVSEMPTNMFRGIATLFALQQEDICVPSSVKR